jgi:hypothetical protein
MGLRQYVESLFLANVQSENARQVVYPVGAAVAAVSDGAAAAWAWSAYVQIVAAATIPNPCWLVGCFLTLPVVEAFYGDFAIAIGAAGFEVDLAIFPFGEQLFAVVEGKSVTQYLPKPIRIVGSPRLAVTVRKNTAASAAGASLKVICATGIGA